MQLGFGGEKDVLGWAGKFLGREFDWGRANDIAKGKGILVIFLDQLVIVGDGFECTRD